MKEQDYMELISIRNKLREIRTNLLRTDKRFDVDTLFLSKAISEITSLLVFGHSSEEYQEECKLENRLMSIHLNK